MKGKLLLLLTLVSLQTAVSAKTKESKVEKNHLLEWKIGNTTARIGGFISLLSYVDFNGSINNKDFAPALAPSNHDWQHQNTFNISPSASRIFLSVVHQSEKLGEIKSYVEGDFRGTGGAFRLRHAYVEAMGFVVGQTNSFMVDFGSTAPTLDIQGTNSRTLMRSPLIGYTHKFAKNYTVALSLEMPTAMVSYNAATNFDGDVANQFVKSTDQRSPDIIFYLQTKGKVGHLRAVGLYRTLSYTDLKSNSIAHTSGYGGKLTASLNVAKPLTIYGEAVYGKGIARYINDLSRAQVDMLPSTLNDGTMACSPMYGASLGLKLALSKSVTFGGNYSITGVDPADEYELPNCYYKGDYLSSTLMWSVTKNLTLGAEYLFGSHTNMDNAYFQANRAQFMVKYDF